MLKPPDPFLEVRASITSGDVDTKGLCVGYELNEWRYQDFVRHAMEWLPEFCLAWNELQEVAPGDMVRLVTKAAHSVYSTDKFKNRGEFGELFLHMAVRQVCGSIPAISKIYYKSARNDTVKGFDAVHVIESSDGLELWLGESKFYQDISSAIRDVVEELKDHTQIDYLKDEFVLIGNKIDPNFEHADELKKLLSPNTSLDEVFVRMRIPVLLTYNSKCVQANTACDDTYCEAFEAEIQKHAAVFASKGLPDNISIHLFLLPLQNKSELVKKLDERLKAWQEI